MYYHFYHNLVQAKHKYYNLHKNINNHGYIGYINHMVKIGELLLIKIYYLMAQMELIIILNKMELIKIVQ